MHKHTDVPPLPDDIAAFLEAEKMAPEPNPETRERVFKRCAMTLGLPISGPGAPAAPPDGSAISGSAGTGGLVTFTGAGKIALVVAALGLGGIAVLSSVVTDSVRSGGNEISPPDVPQNPAVTIPDPDEIPQPTAVDSGQAPEDVAETASQKAKKERPQRRESDTPTTEKETLQKERQLIEQARAFLRAGAPDRSLALLKQHRRQYQHGKLAEEREALYILALVKMGKRQTAENQAKRFYQRFPSSVFRDTIAQSIAASRTQ